MDPPSKISYRQVGRGKQGTMMRGAPLQMYRGDEQPRTVASIPSKFETTLHLGSRETNAFGARTHRFHESENEMPGPGSYYKPATLVRQGETCGSVSKLGYGAGFVSKTNRFGATEDYPPTASMPGPGQYNPSRTGPKTFSAARSTGIFAEPRHYRDETPLVTKSTPGPGQYNARMGSRLEVARKNKQSSTFKSACARGFQPRSDGVAPGEYNIPSTLDKYTRQAPGGPHASFISASDRASVLRSNNVPGPGAYDSTTAERLVRTDMVKEQQGSAVFSNHMHDRFGKSYVPRTTADATPGPGWYERAHPPPDKQIASSAAFVSGTVRGERLKPQREIKAPGPAFYKPTAGGGGRSFLLNATKKWV